MKTLKEQGCKSPVPSEGTMAPQSGRAHLFTPADEAFSAAGRALTAISSRLRDPEKLCFIGTLKLANAGMPGG